MKIVSWFFGLGWSVAGLQIAVNESVAGGLLMLMAGLIVLPFTREKANEWLKKKDDTLSINNKKAFGFAFVFAISSVAFFGPELTPQQKADKAEKAAARVQLIKKEKAEREKIELAAEREEECSDTITPMFYVQKIVKQNLKAPATADFPFYDKNQIQHLGDCVYQVRSYVDSQNSFGAKIRSNFYVRLKRGETEYDWQVLHVEIN